MKHFKYMKYMYLLWLALGTFKLFSMLGYVNNWNLVLGYPLLKAESETVFFRMDPLARGSMSRRSMGRTRRARPFASTTLKVAVPG